MATIVNRGSSANDGTGDPLRTAFGKINDNFQYTTPEQYGAVGDGSTNDSTAIQNAIDSGIQVYFGNKNYRITTAIVIPSNASIVGCGPLTTISTTSNISMFSIQGINISIEGMSFDGNSTGAQKGIDITGNSGFTNLRYNIKIRNCKFTRCASSGIYAINIVGSSAGTKHEGGIQVSDCVFETNGTGVLLDTRAEYCTFSNCNSYNNTTVGVRFNGGNNTWIGGTISDNPTGVFIGSGTNDGHGVMCGVKINHNTTNVQSTSTATGYLFIGCFMWAGNITLTTTNGIKFHDCSFSTLTISANTSTRCEFMNCHFQTDPTMSLTSTTLVTSGCVFETGNLVSPFNNAGSATLTFGLIATLSTSTQTITVTGAAVGDIVALGINNTSHTAGLVFTAWVSAANTVSVQCYNSTLGGITPTAAIFKAMILKDR